MVLWADDIAKSPHDLAVAFVVGILRLVAPRIVDRHAEFPRLIRCVNGHSLFRGGVVAVAAHAAVEDDFRAEIFEEAAHLCKVPLRRGAFPIAVEPEQVGMEATAKLLKLGAVELEKTRPGAGILGLPFAGIGDAEFGVFEPGGYRHKDEVVADGLLAYVKSKQSEWLYRSKVSWRAGFLKIAD